MSEKELRNQVIDYLERRGFMVVWLANEFMRERFKAKGLRRGLPDLLVIGEGGFLCFIELKAGRRGLSEAQKEVMAELERRGFAVFVIRSVEELQKALTL